MSASDQRKLCGVRRGMPCLLGADNVAAISVNERLGFVVRRQPITFVWQRTETNLL